MPRHATARLLLLGMLYPWILGKAAEEPCFRLEDQRLTVTSSRLALTIEGGTITGLKTLETKEVFSAAEAPADRAQAEAERRRWNRTPIWPDTNSPCELTTESRDEAVLIYRQLSGGLGGEELRYRIRVEPSTGDILLQAIFRHPSPTNPPAANIPLVEVKTAAVILGSGARYTRADPPVVNSSVRPSNNLYAPPVAVLEGTGGCVFLWSDSFRGLHNVTLDHRADLDHVSLTTARDYLETEPGTTRSVVWRFSAVPTWLDAAQRYRASFERELGARPLWDYPVAWVRGIHAVHTEAPGGGHGSPTPEQAEAYYRNLAGTIEPSKLLLFYWNGNGIVLFGDHRYMTKLGWPKAPAIEALRRHSFRWMGYHPYVLIFAPAGVAARLEDIEKKGWGIPEGYVFTPDSGGAPDDFYNSFRPVANGYYQGDRSMDTMDGLWVLHPGSRRVREYLTRNFGNYCRFHQMDGAYMDILGVGAHNWEFPEQRKVIDGLDGQGGEAAALREMLAALPELAIMSECQGEATTASTFYTWAGSGHFTMPRVHQGINTKLDHPLRTALWGSYTWTREEGLDAAESALVGGLPKLVLSDDWSVARARCFADEELFNDLPPRWDPEALAYYRGRDSRWFQFRRLPYGDGYVALKSDGGYEPRLVRLQGQTASPLDVPARIQGWIAYRGGKPFGLNPECVYPLLFEAPVPEGLFWLTDLPDGAFVRSVHHTGGQSVVTLDAVAGHTVTGEVSAVLHRKCLRICGPVAELQGPFATQRVVKLSVPIPGGLVFVWEEPRSLDGRFQSRFSANTGHTLPHGVPNHQGWSYQSAITATRETVNGQDYPTISIGPGRYGGYAEDWVRFEPDATPVLKFDPRQPAPADKRTRPPPPLLWSVRVNGQTLWQEEVPTVDPNWPSREVDLSRFAGRTVLLTLSAKRKHGANLSPSPSDGPAIFRRVRFDLNPDPLNWPDEAEGTPDIDVGK